LKYKIRRLAFTCLFPVHLMIINIIFVTLRDGPQEGKICVLDLPQQYTRLAVVVVFNNFSLQQSLTGSEA